MKMMILQNYILIIILIPSETVSSNASVTENVMYCCKFDDILDDEDDFLAVVRFWEMKGCRSFESPTSPSSSLSFFLDLLRCHLRRTILCEGKMLTKGNILKICKEKLKKMSFAIFSVKHICFVYYLKVSQKRKTDMKPDVIYSTIETVNRMTHT